MGGILRGISVALLITILILLGGLLWSAANLGGIKMSLLVDAGVVASCLAGGFQAGKETRQWISGAAAGVGYVLIGVLILALFLPVSGTGVLEVFLEGGLIGLAGGVLGARIYRGNAGRKPLGKKGRDYLGRDYITGAYGEREEQAKDRYPLYSPVAAGLDGKTGGGEPDEENRANPFGAEDEEDKEDFRREIEGEQPAKLSGTSPWWDEEMR